MYIFHIPLFIIYLFVSSVQFTVQWSEISCLQPGYKWFATAALCGMFTYTSLVIITDLSLCDWSVNMRSSNIMIYWHHSSFSSKLKSLLHCILCFKTNYIFILFHYIYIIFLESTNIILIYPFITILFLISYLLFFCFIFTYLCFTLYRKRTNIFTDHSVSGHSFCNITKYFIYCYTIFIFIVHAYKTIVRQL